MSRSGRIERDPPMVERNCANRVENIFSCQQGRRLISTEFELKLAAPPAKLEKLKRVLLAMPTVKSEVRLKLVSTYYDTPALALHRERLSLRVRKQGREFVQTVKAENPTQADVLERKEWEDHIPSKRPVLDAPKTGKRLPDMVRDEELHPVFTTTVTRKFLGSLFDKDRVRTFVKFLKSLQDDLGYANDVRVAHDLVDQISEATNQDARSINRAGGIVLGWHERVLADRNQKVRRHVRRFRRLDPFW